MMEYPRRLHHDTPSWVPAGALFHIRIRTAPRESSLIEPGRVQQILQSVVRYHAMGHWWCELVLLMPDHLHAILGFPREPGMVVCTRNWKRGTARFQRVRWQEGFFDHRLRTNDEANEKWQYVRRNPVVKNLCVDEDAWPWWWSSVVANRLWQPNADNISIPGGTR